MTNTDQNRTTAEHAPGPWHLEPLVGDGGASIAICNTRQGVLAIIPPLNEADGPDEFTAVRDPHDEANARLMAAAPELLAACRMVVDRWERGDLAEAARACCAAVETATAA